MDARADFILASSLAPGSTRILPGEGRGREVEQGGYSSDQADSKYLLLSRRRNKWTRILRVVLMPLESSYVYT